jgi:adenylate kinase family enzyme
VIRFIYFTRFQSYMDGCSCIIIVGKPGAGKSTIGKLLAEHLDGSYMSLGGFMRENLGFPDPHIGIDKQSVYEALHEHMQSNNASEGVLVLDCHPYPESDLEALQTFLKKPTVTLLSIVHVDAPDEIALRRLERRPRPGQTYEERLKYYNDHAHLIEKLLDHPSALRVHNNVDFENEEAIEVIARELYQKLQNKM